MGPRGRNRRRLTIGALLASAVLIPGCTIPACDVIEDHDLRSDAATKVFFKYPPRVDVGDPVTFAADWDYESGFSNSKASGVFDLDGDGTFETAAPINGTGQTVTRTYDSEQTVTVSHLLNATGFNFFRFDDRSVTRTMFEVDDPDTRANEPPVGAYVITPNPARTGQATSFDSFSSDHDGQVVRHEWDFDGDAIYDVDLGANGDTTFVYDEPGVYRVTLRVTDDKGATSLAGTDLTVIDYHDVAVSKRLTAAAAAAPTELELDISGRKRRDGVFQLNGGELLELGGIARGRFPADQLPGFLQRRNLKVRWAARYYSSMDIASESTNAFGTILFDYPAGGVSCLGFETEAPAGEEPSGFFRVIGGNGKGARIRGQGAGTATVDANGVSFSGAGGLRVAREPFERLGKNGCPSLRDELRRRPENSRVG